MECGVIRNKIMSSDLSKQERLEAVNSLRRFVEEELELEISELQGGFLLEFFLKEIGPLSYNRGIEDAKRFFTMQAEDLGGICFEEPFTHWTKSRSAHEVRRKPQ